MVDVCFLASGLIETENHTNAQLVLTLMTRPGIFSFHFLPFFVRSSVCFLFCSVSNRHGEDRAAFYWKVFDPAGSHGTV